MNLLRKQRKWSIMHHRNSMIFYGRKGETKTLHVCSLKVVISPSIGDKMSPPGDGPNCHP